MFSHVLLYVFGLSRLTKGEYYIFKHQAFSQNAEIEKIVEWYVYGILKIDSDQASRIIFAQLYL